MKQAELRTNTRR